MKKITRYFATIIMLAGLNFPNAVMGSEEAQEGLTLLSTRVIDYVEAAKKNRSNYRVAQAYFTEASKLVERARAGDGDVDASGKVGQGIFQELTVQPFSRTEEMYYDDSWPLRKRAYILKYHTASCASGSENYLEAARLYREGAEISNGEAPNYHRLAAMNYGKLGEYENMLDQIDLAKQTALLKGYKDLIDLLSELCAEQATVLDSTDTLMAQKFRDRIMNFPDYDTV